MQGERSQETRQAASRRTFSLANITVSVQDSNTVWTAALFRVVRLWGRRDTAGGAAPLIMRASSCSFIISNMDGGGL